jgi:hypothetical protein
VSHDRDDEDPGLTRMLRAVRAEADPALWTRVRARIEARRRVPAPLAWAMRPTALAASVALLVASATLGLMLATESSVATDEDYATLADALVAERDAEAATVEVAPAPAGDAASDSGSGM